MTSVSYTNRKAIDGSQQWKIASDVVSWSWGAAEIATDVKEENKSFAQLKDFELLPNYPNPFNPSTIISYDLTWDAEISLSVFDMPGREITTLINERKNAGHHAVQFSATPWLASGAYIYVLRAGSFIDRKRMLFVK